MNQNHKVAVKEVAKSIVGADMSKFNWIGQNTKNYRKAQTDVSISIIRNGDKANSISFVLRNDVWKNFGERVAIAVYKNRVLFRTDENGAKVDTRGIKNCTNRYLKFRVDETTERLKAFVGDYELKYDDFYELYYIEMV